MDLENTTPNGLAAYHEFLNKRVFTQEEALTDPIPACNLKLIRHELDKKSSNITEKALTSDIKDIQARAYKASSLKSYRHIKLEGPIQPCRRGAVP